MQRAVIDESSYPLIEEEEEEDTDYPRHVAPPTVIPTETTQSSACPFGVRSYLHLFYASPSTSEIGHTCCEECIQEEDKRSSRMFTRMLCKAFMWTGINVILVGIITLLVSFILPKRPLIVGRKNNLEIFDHSALDYNDIIDRCHLAGLTLLCLGAAVLLVALLLFSFLPARGVAPSSPVHLCPTTTLHSPSLAAQHDMISPPPLELFPIHHKLSRVQPSFSNIP